MITPSGDPISMLALAIPMSSSTRWRSSSARIIAEAAARPTHRRGRRRVTGRRGCTEFELDPFQVEAIDALDGGAVGAGGRAHRARARRWWPSTPSTGPWPHGRQGLLHDADQGALEPEVRATWPAATAPTGSACSPATTRINGDAPVVVMTTEVLRNMIYAGSPALRRARASSSSTRSTTSRTPTAARCGRR